MPPRLLVADDHQDVLSPRPPPRVEPRGPRRRHRQLSGRRRSAAVTGEQFDACIDRPESIAARWTPPRER